jgi:hypothetical protein
MYMAAVHGGRPPVTVQLYKHIDTRRYLNLDDAGHAYAYQLSSSELGRPESGGRYRRYRSVVGALVSVDLQAFEGDTPLFRSFPPEEWSKVSIDRRDPPNGWIADEGEPHQRNRSVVDHLHHDGRRE